jgi:dihydrofolate reductase
MPMSSVVAAITMSVDGYVAGPDDSPERGLGRGGERLHYWVFGGPWTYADRPEMPEPTGTDAEWMNGLMSRIGAVIAGRGVYESSGRWGGENPWPVPAFVLTHHPEEMPHGGGFTFVDGLSALVEQARAAAGDKDVHVMGGAETIRGMLAAGLVDELSIIVAPVVLGGGKRLFDGFTESVDLEHVGFRQSPYSTFIDYRVRR